MIKAAAEFIWEKTPWWVKWPAIVIVGPNLTVNFFVFFVYVAPWVNQNIHATVRTYEDKRDAQHMYLEKRLESMDQKLNILIQRR
jgi:hypothetical protein